MLIRICTRYFQHGLHTSYRGLNTVASEAGIEFAEELEEDEVGFIVFDESMNG